MFFLKGYIKAGSVHSLSYGLIFGAILAAGAYMNGLSPPQPLGQLVVSLILLVMMGWRFYETGKFMPAGLIVILSAIVLVRGIVVYREYIPFIGGIGKEK